MKWTKLGLLYCPSETNRHQKLLSHAANPLAIHICNDVYRIFYSGRDSRNRSSVGAVDVDINTKTIIHEHLQPFFEHGDTGSFYADGVSIGNCYSVGDVRYMLFMGWQSPANDHWRGDIGRLVVNPDLSLELDSHQPFLGTDEVDEISLSYPWVIQSATNDYRMWYGSTKSWDAGNGEMLHVINYAKSADGNIWDKQGLSVPYKIGFAQAFSRPTVLKSGETDFHMWFSYRDGNGKKYRIGYACSQDGVTWQLQLEKSGIDVSDSGWDSEMIEYPFVFRHGNEYFMLYNGNGYGKSGFGLAVLDRTEVNSL